MSRLYTEGISEFVCQKPLGRPQIGQQPDRYGFSQFEPLTAIRAPMHTSEVTAKCNIGC